MRTLLAGGLTALLIATAPRVALAQTVEAPPAAQPAPGAVQPAPAAAQPAAPAAAASAQPISQAEVDNWDSDKPVPRGYHVESKRRVGMIVGGAVITGVMWGFTALGAALYHAGDTAVDNVGMAIGQKSNVTSVTPLYIPVAGPFIQVATTGGAAFGKGLLLVDGLIQLGGAAMMLYGILVPREYLAAGEKAAQNKGTFMLAPTLSRGQAGMGLVGTF